MRILQYFITTIKHKRIVAKRCFMCGLYFQGLFHDNSKFMPLEFFKSLKYTIGLTSQNDQRYHNKRNKHHWEYWIDENDNPQKVPFKYVLEMICDESLDKKAILHSDTQRIIKKINERIKIDGIEKTLKDKEYLKGLKEEYGN